MSLSLEDMDKIKAEMLDIGKKYFVQIDDCNNQQKIVDGRLAKGDKQFAIVNLKLSIITWGIGIIASGVIVFIIDRILNLIMGG